jgi:hypothetical protein
MDLRICEPELQAMHVWHASMVILVKRGEASGVPIFEAPAVAPPASFPIGIEFPYHLLVIEVDDPEDRATQDRIRCSLSKFDV